jgi:hypothetical protein
VSLSIVKRTSHASREGKFVKCAAALNFVICKPELHFLKLNVFISGGKS